MLRWLPPSQSIVVVLLALTSTLPLYAQDETQYQFLPEVDVYVRTSYDTRMFFFSALTRERPVGTIDGFIAGQFEVGLPPYLRELFTDYDDEAQPFDFLRFKAGILYMRDLDGDAPVDEWRGMIELIPREIFYGSVTFIMRNRVELRWIAGDYSTRLRTRLWLERTFFIDSPIPVTPYINTEPFYDFRYNAFTRLLSQAGVAFGVTKWFAPEILFGIQRDWTPVSATTYHVGLTATFYF